MLGRLLGKGRLNCNLRVKGLTAKLAVFLANRRDKYADLSKGFANPSELAISSNLLKVIVVVVAGRVDLG